MASRASVPGSRTDGGATSQPQPQGSGRARARARAGRCRLHWDRARVLPPCRPFSRADPAACQPCQPMPAGLKDMGGRCARVLRMIPSGRMVQSSTPRAGARASARACEGMRGTHGRPSENLCHAPRPFAVGTPYATPRPRTPLLRESPAEKYKFRENPVPLLLSVLACAIMSASWRRWHQR